MSEEYSAEWFGERLRVASRTFIPNMDCENYKKDFLMLAVREVSIPLGKKLESVMNAFREDIEEVPAAMELASKSMILSCLATSVYFSLGQLPKPEPSHGETNAK